MYFYRMVSPEAQTAILTLTLTLTLTLNPIHRTLLVKVPMRQSLSTNLVGLATVHRSAKN